MKKIFYILFCLIFIFGCSKEKEILPTKDGEPIDYWEKFIGSFNVYDTLGNYLYDIEISHHSRKFFSGGQYIDTLLIENFADTFNVKFQYQTGDPYKFHIGFHDSIVDYNNKSWGLWGMYDDNATIIEENTLINDTIIFYYDLDNIKYYIQEAQPYYQCHCKVVAVKQ